MVSVHQTVRASYCDVLSTLALSRAVHGLLANSIYQRVEQFWLYGIKKLWKFDISFGKSSLKNAALYESSNISSTESFFLLLYAFYRSAQNSVNESAGSRLLRDRGWNFVVFSRIFDGLNGSPLVLTPSAKVLRAALHRCYSNTCTLRTCLWQTLRGKEECVKWYVLWQNKQGNLFHSFAERGLLSRLMHLAVQAFQR